MTFTVTVSNDGASGDGPDSISVAETIQPDLDDVTATPSDGSYSAGTWTLELAAGDSATLQITGMVDPGATGPVTNTATLTPPSGSPTTPLAATRAPTLQGPAVILFNSSLQVRRSWGRNDRPA